MGVTLLNITPSDPLAFCFLPCDPMLYWHRDLSSTGRNCYPRIHGNDSSELEAKTATVHFGHLTPLNQQAKNGITLPAGVIRPDYQGEIGLVFHSGGKEKSVWKTGDSLGHLSVSSCKLNGKLQSR